MKPVLPVSRFGMCRGSPLVGGIEPRAKRRGQDAWASPARRAEPSPASIGLMKFGVIVTGGAPNEQVELARMAEAAGWDGVFTWDGIHVGDDIETYDPWALMAAFAVVTKRVILGAIIHPLPRRKPWELARQAVTVDRLSDGRLVLPVGLGALGDAGVTGFGEPTERRVRAERLDESLEILQGLWSGEPYEFHGRHYDFSGPLAFQPTPVQRPRIPI